MEMTKGFRFAEGLSRLAGVPQEAFSAAPRITVSGGSRVLIEGHRGLLEYSAERIAASAAGCRVIVKGEGLGLEAMNAKELVVSGRLWAVELE